MEFSFYSIRNTCSSVAIVLFYLLIGYSLVIIVTCTSRTKLQDNGYEKVVVAIAPHIDQKDGEELIQKIKDLFTDGSKALYAATRQRAYFKNVAILLPSKWNVSADAATFETFLHADVRIDDPNPTYQDGPYTLQPLSCGSPGLYIHLTPNYLKELGDESTTRFGHPGKTLVHEWAHLRYGIFDEFGYRGSRQFPVLHFKEHEELVPNACVNSKLEGTFKNGLTGSSCTYEDGYPDENCIFVPHEKENSANTSIASYHFLPNVVTFCDDTKVHRHNPENPNKHNLLCDSKSTWEVISEHPDLKDNNLEREIANVTPTFQLVQQHGAYFCLLLDNSVNMKDSLKPIKMILQRWFRSAIPLGFSVGIVKFGDGATTLKSIQKIDETRETLANALDNWKADEQKSCMGCGLIECVNQLQDSRTLGGGNIILIANGKADDSKLEDGVAEVLESAAHLVSITLADDDAHLKKLVQDTSGKAYFVPDDNLDTLEEILNEIITEHSVKNDTRIMIHKNSFNSDFSEGIFFVDETVGRETSIDFRFAEFSDIANIRVTGPSVNVDLETTFVSNKDPSYIFSFPVLSSGRYNYSITTKIKQDIRVIVMSKAKSSEIKPITIRSWVHTELIASEEHPVHIILAEVKQGYNPVTNAEVLATINTSKKQPIQLQLFDDGIVADITKNDGIYSRYVSSIPDKGRYTVHVKVTGGETTSILETGFQASGSMPVVNHYTANIAPSSRPIDSLERLAIADQLNVEKTINLEDFPPARTTDLEVINIETDTNFTSVLLQWTVPGAHLDVGKAKSYELRYDSNWTMLHDHYEAIVNTTQVDFPPNGSRTLETFALNISKLEVGVNLYVALRSSNDDGKNSPISNIVSVQMITSENVDEYELVPVIVGIVLGGLFVIFLIAVVVFHFKQKKLSE